MFRSWKNNILSQVEEAALEKDIKDSSSPGTRE